MQPQRWFPPRKYPPTLLHASNQVQMAPRTRPPAGSSRTRSLGGLRSTPHPRFRSTRDHRYGHDSRSRYNHALFSLLKPITGHWVKYITFYSRSGGKVVPQIRFPVFLSHWEGGQTNTHTHLISNPTIPYHTITSHYLPTHYQPRTKPGCGLRARSMTALGQ